MLTRVLFLGGALAVLPSCHSSALFLPGCLPVTDRATCSFDVTDPATAHLLLGGTIDAWYAGQYTCVALVEGRDLGTPITLFEAEVQVLDPVQGGAVLTEFSVPITGSVDPGTGFGTASVVSLDATTLQALEQKVFASGEIQTVVSRFFLRGRDAGGAELDTPLLDYPIAVSAANSCAGIPGQPCVGTAPAMPDCRLGSDEPVGTSCTAIASQLGVCRKLECDVDTTTGKSDLASARCPVHFPPDDSCCN
jgi:hypothetical protein